jgi:heme/copper-type cytochrome/quinol oxidase subunit 3
MSSTAPVRRRINAEFQATARPGAWWGMVMFIVTEATVFALLITSYFYLRAAAVSWPPEDIKKPELLLSSINTVILLGSSVPMFVATRAISRGQRRTMAIALGLSFIMGAVFLGIQGWEFSQLEFEFNDNAYASSFWFINGSHGLHVAIALVFVLYLLARTAAGHFTERRHLAVENVALYWHFVDAVWIAVFLSLHVSPHFLPRT